MKTIEEASVEYSKEQYDHDPIMRFQCETHFEAGIEFAQRWIPVEEEFPPIGVPVTCKYNVFDKEYYWSGTFISDERMMHFIKKHLEITHWRPINLK